MVDCVRGFLRLSQESAMSSRIAEVRAFTRFYTAVIGVLDEGLLGTPYSAA